MTEDTTPDDDDLLLPLADKIAEGEAINWDDQGRKAPEESRHLLLALREIASVEAAHRRAEQSFEEAQSAEAADPRQWRHLTILEKVGRGQFGDVYRAFDSNLQREVALKLSAKLTAATTSGSLMQEARLLARIHHPNIVRIFDADYCDGRVGIWMDFVRGRTLQDMLKSQRCSSSEVTNIGIELCRAVAAIHAGGVLHGDIKAHNVIRRDDGELVIVDFGAGRQLDAVGGGHPDMSGTLVYMAPEVLRGEGRSRASDIYSLGVLLFHLVTDSYPVFATSREGALAVFDEHRQTPLRDLRPDVHTQLADVIARATSADPRERFQSAGAMEAALLRHDSSPAPAPSAAWRWPAVSAIAVLAAIATLAALWMPTAPNEVVPLSLFGGTSAGPTASIEGAAASAPSPASYRIDVKFYRTSAAGSDLLSSGQSIRVGDQLNLTANASAPIYLYVINEDEKGRSFLLFPTRGTGQDNHIEPGGDVRVPGSANWVIDSDGKREHLLVFASPERLEELENIFATLPSPVERNETAVEISAELKDTLRGVGTVAPAAGASHNLHEVYTTPLTGPETVTGRWVRRLSLESVKP